MTVVTRFAPSPTGFLHIGGARTALYNWLFARHHGGTFLLRIEDTDRKRSTPEAIEAILAGMTWLGLDWDGEAVYQFARAARHAACVQELLAKGRAYHCYCTPEELQKMREEARAEGRPNLYDGRWRDRDPAEAPAGIDPVVRLKAPQEGETVIDDQVQGSVTVANAQLDDMVMLRADGTPTYMLSVVVDDHDMEISHVIRGDDHLTNAFRQTLLYQALGWTPPAFAHIPLIHGRDGKKLSKRDGALAVQDYRDMGYLPEALRNYLLRLGWSHGDDEIISTDQAIAWFDLDGVGRSPARFDKERLDSLNGSYIREADPKRLVDLVASHLEAEQGRQLDQIALTRLAQGMEGLRMRAKTVVELAENAAFYAAVRPLPMSEKAQKLLGGEAPSLLAGLCLRLEADVSWQPEALETSVRGFAEERNLNLGKVAQPLRAALTGSHASPGLFEVMAVLGRAETLARIQDQAAAAAG